MNSFSSDDKKRILYYVVEQLNKIAKDRERINEDRMFCLVMMYKISAQHGDPFCHWITPDQEMRYYIQSLVLMISYLPEKTPEKMKIIEKAALLMVYYDEVNDDGDRQYFDQMKSNLSTNPVEFSSSEETFTNTVMSLVLQQRMIMNYFLSSLAQRGKQEYNKYVKPLTIIRIEGDMYIDGKLQNEEMREKAESKLKVNLSQIENRIKNE